MQLIHHLTDNSLKQILDNYGMLLSIVDETKPIPGSHWGDSEAGLINSTLYVRGDTPIHSALHETCHYICMDNQRRSNLHTDAGGGYNEENAVCYLQILLADSITGNSKESMMREMDEWGYSFRLGTTKKWFSEDAEDAKQWLLDFKLINKDNSPTWMIKT